MALNCAFSDTKWNPCDNSKNIKYYTAKMNRLVVNLKSTI